MAQWISQPEFRGLPFHIAAVEFPEAEHPINQYSVVLSAELQGYLCKIARHAGAKDPEALGQQLTILFEGAALVERLAPNSGAASRAKLAAITLTRHYTPTRLASLGNQQDVTDLSASVPPAIALTAPPPPLLAEPATLPGNWLALAHNAQGLF
ncbi:conserved hypothetical protein [Ricinus communis]|uniref:Uncharacterized protein n=1 Tax=Ricinus communis TaxID=3988 RepID=B9TPN4_RICCO|nr:conserved hypothetical protein [Ricinus communis]